MVSAVPVAGNKSYSKRPHLVNPLSCPVVLAEDIGNHDALRAAVAFDMSPNLTPRAEEPF